MTTALIASLGVYIVLNTGISIVPDRNNEKKNEKTEKKAKSE